MSSNRSRDVLTANIVYHSALAGSYDARQPHFRPENVSRVDAILRRLSEATGGRRLLDIGCGTGFVLNIAKAHFDDVVGVDATPAMLAKVNRVSSRGRVAVCRGDTGSLPFPTATLHACTASGSLHHLFDA